MELSPPSAGRSAAIDIAKGVGILLVVAGHSPPLIADKGEVFRIIYSFHVPLFFFLSGIFLRREAELPRFLRSRASGLLKPYFVILLILAMLKGAAAFAAAPGDLADAGAPLAGVVWGNGRTTIWPPMWFLPHLFLASLAALALLKAPPLRSPAALWTTTAVLFVAGLAAMAWVRHLPPEPLGPITVRALPWSADLLPVSVAILLAGHLLAPRVREMRFPAAGLAVSLAVFAALHAGFDQTMDLNARAYGSPAIVTAEACAGIWLVLSLSALLARSAACERVLAYIGRGTLCVLIFHYFIQFKVFAILSGHGLGPAASAAIAFAVAVAVPLAIWEAAKRNAAFGRVLLPGRARA